MAEVEKVAIKKQTNIYAEAVQEEACQFFKSRKFLSDGAEPAETLRSRESSWFHVS